jgi:hypothetical protein
LPLDVVLKGIALVDRDTAFIACFGVALTTSSDPVADYRSVAGRAGAGAAAAWAIAPAATCMAAARPLRSEGERSDFFFVTLRKDEKTFSPETRYRDFALGSRRFHWETQHDTRVDGATAQRYIRHVERGDHIGLFVRETTKAPSGAAEPFTFLGRCTYQSHSSSAPVQIVWELEHQMPAELLEVARLVAG